MADVLFYLFIYMYQDDVLVKWLKRTYKQKGAKQQQEK